MLLKGQNIVITGGAGLLASAFATHIVQEQGRVILADSNLNKAKELCETLNQQEEGCAHATSFDITSSQSVAELINFASQACGRVDSVVNCAYPRNQSYGALLEDVTLESFNENVNLQLGGYFLVTQQFAQYFRSNKITGRVINIASIYGSKAPRFSIYKQGETMPVEYSVIKAGLIQLSQYFARYYNQTGIRFNTISPGGILNQQDPKFIERYNEYGLSKGMLEPTDVSGACVFLLSPLSDYINGQDLVVDDGWTL
jgi:NAD(P)-dependent dehydrogenase (short-subunit alcohol dehydrogenase family)